MKCMDFSDNYIILIIAGLFALYFFRPIAQSLLTCLQDIEARLTNDCCLACFGCRENICFAMIRTVLILFTFLQPFLFAVVHLYKSSTKQPQLKLELTTYSTHNLQDMLRSNATITAVDFEQYTTHVDFMILALPWNTGVAVVCIVWVHLGNTHALDADGAWDDSQESAVVAYDLAYLIECALCNIVFISSYCPGERISVVILQSTSIGLLLAYFIAQARVQERSVEDNMIVMGALIALFALLFLIWQSSAAWDKQGTALIAGAHAVIVCVIACFHVVVSGAVTAGAVVLTRVFVTSAACAVMLAFYAYS